MMKTRDDESVFLTNRGCYCITALLSDCFKFLDAAKQTLTKLDPNSPFREGCHVPGDALQAACPNSSRVEAIRLVQTLNQTLPHTSHPTNI